MLFFCNKTGGKERLPLRLVSIDDKILEKNMRPVYDSARKQGYEIWMF